MAETALLSALRAAPLEEMTSLQISIQKVLIRITELDILIDAKIKLVAGIIEAGGPMDEPETFRGAVAAKTYPDFSHWPRIEEIRRISVQRAGSMGASSLGQLGD